MPNSPETFNGIEQAELEPTFAEDIEARSATERLLLSHETVFDPNMPDYRRAMFEMNHEKRIAAAQVALQTAAPSITNATTQFALASTELPDAVRSEMESVLEELQTASAKPHIPSLLVSLRHGMNLTEKLESTAIYQEPRTRKGIEAFDRVMRTYHDPIAAYTPAYIRPTMFIPDTGLESTKKTKLYPVLKLVGFGFFSLMAIASVVFNIRSPKKSLLLTAIYAGLAYVSINGLRFGEPALDRTIRQLNGFEPGSSFERAVLLPYRTHATENQSYFANMVQASVGSSSFQSVEEDPQQCREKLLAACGTNDVGTLPPDVQQFLQDDKAVKAFVSRMTRIDDPEAQEFTVQYFRTGMGPQLIGDASREIRDAQHKGAIHF
jgi:hypothetical protein